MRGLWGFPGPGAGVPLPVSYLAGTTAADPTVRPVTEVWVGDDNGVPVLVWASVAQAPSGVAITNVAAGVQVAFTVALPARATSFEVRRPDGSLVGGYQAALTVADVGTYVGVTVVDGAWLPLNGSYSVTARLDPGGATAVAYSNTLDMRPQTPTVGSRSYATLGTVMSLAWTIPTLANADGFDVRRPDGSLAGTVAVDDRTKGSYSMSDGLPRPLSGSYTVSARKNATSGPVATFATLDLSTPPLSPAATYDGSFWTIVSWAAPSWGLPDGYQIWRNGVLIDAVGPGFTVREDTAPPAGLNNGYQVVALLSGYGSQPSTTVYAPRPANPPTAVALYRQQVDISTSNWSLYWATPTGFGTSYEVQYRTGTDNVAVLSNTWVALGSPDYGTETLVLTTVTPTGAMQMRIRMLSAGGTSPWATSNVA